MSTIQIKVPNWLDKICAWPVMLYRKQKYGYSYRRIPLGEGKYTIVDPQDFYRFNIFNWCLKDHGSNIYAARLAAAPQKRMRIKIISLHREIMGHPEGLFVDHKNGDGLDNRRDNLRLATREQNMCNRRKTKSKTSSRFTGVSFNKRIGRWSAYVGHCRKNIFLGYFDDEITAARTHDAAAKKYHGEFARLNFPEAATPS
jgi:hypothetical protein